MVNMGIHVHIIGLKRFKVKSTMAVHYVRMCKLSCFHQKVHNSWICCSTNMLEWMQATVLSQICKHSILNLKLSI